MIIDLESNRKYLLMKVFVSNQNKTKILITKSDGSYLYLTTDLATVKHRLENILLMIFFTL